MDRFVLVRLVHVERLDLSLFNFDPELSFTVFFMNADKTIYGRFGTRSDFYESERDISLAGLRKAMRGALALHAAYPDNKASLAGKRGPKRRYQTITDYPSMRRRGGFRRGCVHCHHIGSAEQKAFRSAGKPIPDEVLFSFPMPDAVGIGLDPKEIAAVNKIWPRSPAERAGLKTGDEILALAGQPVLSIADVQWVLHNTPATAKLNAQVLREGKKQNMELTLQPGWRRYVDISWRTSTVPLRESLLGGMVLEDLAAEERKQAGLPDAGLALKIVRLFRTARAYEAGLRSRDVIVEVDGRKRYMSEGDLMAHCAQEKMPGQFVELTVLRSGERHRVKLKVE